MDICVIDFPPVLIFLYPLSSDLVDLTCLWLTGFFNHFFVLDLFLIHWVQFNHIFLLDSFVCDWVLFDWFVGIKSFWIVWVWISKFIGFDLFGLDWVWFNRLIRFNSLWFGQYAGHLISGIMVIFSVIVFHFCGSHSRCGVPCRFNQYFSSYVASSS